MTQLQKVMNEQVELVQTWLLANKLSVHYVDKSQYILVNSNNHIHAEDCCFELKMGLLIELKIPSLEPKPTHILE